MTATGGHVGTVVEGSCKETSTNSDFLIVGSTIRSALKVLQSRKRPRSIVPRPRLSSSIEPPFRAPSDIWWGGEASIPRELLSQGRHAPCRPVCQKWRPIVARGGSSGNCPRLSVIRRAHRRGRAVPGEQATLAKRLMGVDRRPSRAHCLGACAVVVAMAVAIPAVATSSVALASASGLEPGNGLQQATDKQVLAYLTRAQARLNGSFVTSYWVSAGPGHLSTVYGAQLWDQVTMYRETPPLAWFGPRPVPRSYEVFEVFPDWSRVAGVGIGFYSCTQGAPRGMWSCQGPYNHVGMGGTFQLTAPYPPPELLRGLANASYTYLNLAFATRRPTERAYFFSEGRQQCIGFGSQRHFVGSACLGAHDLVSNYQLPRSATVGTYLSAKMLSFSSRIAPIMFRLPATPTPVRS